MHIILGVLGIVAAIGIWWWRIKYIGEAANEVADRAGRVRGHFRRKKLRAKAAESPITAIEDPVVAAATILISIYSEDGPFLPEVEENIRQTIGGIAGSEGALDEAMIYAKWAASQVDDTLLVIDRAGRFLNSKLNETEKEQLISLVNSVTSDPGLRPKLYKIRMDKLRQRLGLTVH